MQAALQVKYMGTYYLLVLYPPAGGFVPISNKLVGTSSVQIYVCQADWCVCTLLFLMVTENGSLRAYRNIGMHESVVSQ